MRLFRLLAKTLRSYDFRDRLISAFSIAVFLLMILKLIVFPYGLFGFGSSNIYTEGLVSRNGIQNLNPLFVDFNEADREVSRLVFSGLMKFDPMKNAVVDDMANLTINEDKTEYTFVLRDGLRWHDGEPVTANDVMFTFNEVVLSPSFPNELIRANFDGIEIQQIDDKTVQFLLDRPNIFFATNLTVGILPKHLLKDVDPFDLIQDEFNKMPIGTGPYMVNEAVEYFPDGRAQVTLERNPFYYGELSEIEFMRFIVYPTVEQLIAASNSVNGIPKVTEQYKNDILNEDRFELIPYQLPQYTAVFMNMESKIFKDNRLVRLALQKSVFKDELVEEIPGVVGVDTPLLELNQEDWIYQPSLDEAQGALKDAGYSYREEDTEKSGIRYNEEDEALEVNLIALLHDETSPAFEEVKTVVTYLQEQWEGIGFNVQVELLPLLQFEERVINRQYDLVLIGQNLGYNLDTYSFWHSTQADPGGQNLSNYKSFQADSLIEDIRAVFNQEKRERELTELAEKLKEDVPAVFLYRPTYYYATDGKVSGVMMDGVVFPHDRFFDMFLWKFER